MLSLTSLCPHVLLRAIHTLFIMISHLFLETCFSRSLSPAPCTVTGWSFHSVSVSHSSSLGMGLKSTASSADVAGQRGVVNFSQDVLGTLVMDHLWLGSWSICSASSDKVFTRGSGWQPRHLININNYDGNGPTWLHTSLSWNSGLEQSFYSAGTEIKNSLLEL